MWEIQDWLPWWPCTNEGETLTNTCSFLNILWHNYIKSTYSLHTYVRTYSVHTYSVHTVYKGPSQMCVHHPTLGQARAIYVCMYSETWKADHALTKFTLMHILFITHTYSTHVSGLEEWGHLWSRLISQWVLVQETVNVLCCTYLRTSIYLYLCMYFYLRISTSVLYVYMYVLHTYMYMCT